MEKTLSIKLILIAVAAIQTLQLVIAAPNNKVFNYQGSMPIKDETTGNNSNKTEPPAELADAESACWQMINEQSGN